MITPTTRGRDDIYPSEAAVFRSPRNSTRQPYLSIVIGLLVLTGLTSGLKWQAAEASPAPRFDLTPGPDRLATPVLPSSPQPADYGRQVYYLNCMPCHGDVGQGLTDEWRDVWEEDHRDCWASGCHGGRAGDEGFPVPRSIPAVIGASPILGNFHTSEELFDYLKLTHPPQRPGVLSDEDYRNVTVLLWEASNRIDPTPTSSPTPSPSDTPTPAPTATPLMAPAPAAPMLDLPIIASLTLIIGGLIVALTRRGRSAA